MSYTVITCIWTGGTGLPGYSRFKFAGALNAADAGTAAGRVRTFFDAVKTYVPSSISLTVQGEAQIMDDNGKLANLVTFTPPLALLGAGTGGYAAPAGAVVNWNTNDSQGGRRVKGKTFLVPLHSLMFASDGTLEATKQTAIQNAAIALANGTPSMIVPSVHKTLGVVTGVDQFVVVGASVPDRAAILTSRRD